MRLRLFQIIQRAQNNDQVSRWYDFFIVTVAFVSIVPLMFKTEQITPEFDYFLNILDVVTVYILFSDYIFRWATYDIKSGLGKKAFFLYPFSPMAIIDLLSILPSVTILHDSFKFLRILRIVRILRMFDGLTIMTNVFIRERKALLSIIFFMCVYVLAVGLVMFTVEPDTFNNFLDALYWSTTALATIGYGDITPVSSFGKFIAIVSSLVGIAVVAFPAGIITGGYITQLQKARDKGKEYFALPVRHDKVYKGKPITSFKSIKSYFNSNKKVKYYLIWILICLIISIITTFYMNNIDFALIYFDEYGSIIASVVLEPTCGLMVALFNDVLFALSTNSPFTILTFGCGAMYSLIFGVYFRRGRKITVKSIVMVFLVLVIFNTLYIFIVYSTLMPENAAYLANIDYDWVIWFQNFSGQDLIVSLLWMYLIGRIVFALFSIISVLIIRRFLWESKIDPMLKIPVRKRYKLKIYKKGKNEHSYIETWLQDNTDDDESYTEFEAAVKAGKKSIQQSKETIKEKQMSIEQMQQDVEEKLVAIQEKRQEIAKAEEAIGIKRRAVKRVRRKQKLEESDSAISNIASAMINKNPSESNDAPGADTVGQNTDSFKPIKNKENDKKNSKNTKIGKHKKKDEKKYNE